MPFCPNCGKELMPTDAFCLNCGFPVAARLRQGQGAMPPTLAVQQAVPSKDGWRAIVLSFFLAGLGLLYLGKRNRGRIFLGISVVLLALSFINAYLLIPYILFWVYDMVDTFVTARRFSQQPFARAAASA